MSVLALSLAESPTILSARDRMRLLKEALVREEQMEAEAQREQAREIRRVRRESAASMLSVPPTGSPSTFGREMSASTGTSSPTGSIRSVRPILKSSLSASPAHSPNMVRTSSSHSEFGTDFSPGSVGRLQVRRRSSRVRFSEDPKPLGQSSATLPEEKRKSSLESLQEDLALARRNMGISTRPSVISTISDQFDLSASSSPTPGEQVTDFSPQPLRYPSAGRLHSRLSMETFGSPGSSRRSSLYTAPSLPLPPAPVTPERPKAARSASYALSTADAVSRRSSEAVSVASSVETHEDGLRDIINRPSIPDTPACAQTRPSYAPSILSPRPLTRSSRSSSAGQSWSSLRLTRPSLGESLDIPSTSSSFSDGPVDRSTARPLPVSVHLNRKDWEQWSEEQGLSPKATTSSWAEGLLRASEAAIEKRVRKDSGGLSKIDFPVPPSRDSQAENSLSGLGLEMDSEQSAVVDEGCTAANLATPPKARDIQLNSPNPSEYSPGSDILLTPLEYRSSSPDMISAQKSNAQLHLSSSGDEAEESDLDIVTPLARLAVKNRIISPSSSLLRSSERRPMHRRVSSRSSALSLRTGSCMTADKGWSGSESEEEEFLAAIRDISARRRSAATAAAKSARYSEDSTASSTSTSLSSVDMRAEPRLSQLSEPSSATSVTSMDSTSSSTQPLTPPLIKKKLMLAKPGDFAWGSAANSPTGSSPGTPQPSPTSGESGGIQPVLSALLRKLPPPKILVDGWGPPEVLMDDVDAYFPRTMAASPAQTDSDATTITTACSTPVHSTPKLSSLISPETPSPPLEDHLPRDVESGSPLSQLVLKAAAQSPKAQVVYRKSLSPRNARFDRMPFI